MPDAGPGPAVGRRGKALSGRLRLVSKKKPSFFNRRRVPPRLWTSFVPNQDTICVGNEVWREDRRKFGPSAKFKVPWGGKKRLEMGPNQEINLVDVIVVVSRSLFRALFPRMTSNPRRCSGVWRNEYKLGCDFSQEDFPCRDVFLCNESYFWICLKVSRCWRPC